MSCDVLFSVVQAISEEDGHDHRYFISRRKDVWTVMSRMAILPSPRSTFYGCLKLPMLNGCGSTSAHRFGQQARTSVVFLLLGCSEDSRRQNQKNADRGVQAEVQQQKRQEERSNTPRRMEVYTALRLARRQTWPARMRRERCTKRQALKLVVEGGGEEGGEGERGSD